MEKLKKILYLILPFFISIYQIYLIDRIWHFTTKINLMIGIFLICAMYAIFYIFNKKIEYKEISKKKVAFITLISIILSSIILGTNFDFFTKTYKESIVQIYSESEETDIRNFIKNISIDNTLQDIEKLINRNIIELNVKNCKDVIIVFQENIENKNIKIKDGKIEEFIELKNNIYNIESNKIFDSVSIIRLIISFIMIEIISLLICIASYCKYKKDKSIIIPVLLLVAVIRIFVYQQCQLCVMYEDSFDYQACGLDKIILLRQLQDRVPVYPILIQIMTYICDDLWSYFICIFQMIISFVSLIYLYKTLKLIIKWENLIATIVFLYGVSIAVIGWDTIILTESLSLALTIYFSYLIINYINTNKLKYGIGSSIISLIIVFLRPSTLVFIAILFVFFVLKIILDKEHRKNNIVCIICTSIVITFIIGYAFIFYKQRDIFSITSASVRQDLYICMNEGFYKNSNDKQFIEDVEKTIKQNNIKWNAVMEILNEYGNNRIIELVKISKKESFNQYIRYLARLVKEQTNEKFRAYTRNIYEIDNGINNVLYKNIEDFMFVKFSTIYFIIAIEGILSIYKWIKNKKPSWIHLGIFGFTTAIVITAFIGTNAEFMRTSLCALPYCYMSIGLIISECVERYKISNNIE